MREIKVRMWDDELKSFYDSGFSIDMDCYQWRDDNDNSYLFGDRYILMQFTGLFDKNKIEIYFKDIVEYQTKEGTLHSAVVDWSDELCCVMIGEMPYPQLYQSAFTQPSKVGFTILGNIYEHQYLIK